MHPHNDEEEKIIKETVDFQSAWNKADVKTLVEFFTNDSIRVGAFGETQKGKEEIEIAYSKLLNKGLPGSKIFHERGIVRFLSAEIATWQAPFELFSPGAITLKGYTLVILKKTENRWLIDEFHAKFFPSG